MLRGLMLSLLCGLRGRWGATVRGLTLATVLVGGLVGATALRGEEIEPLGMGAYKVACTNMEVKEGSWEGDIQDYLMGKNGWFSSEKYVATLLAQSENPRVVSVKVPANKSLFGKHAGTQIPVVTYVAYPTTADNARPSYTFPYKNTGDNVFTHMQRAGEKPIFAHAGKRYPVILYSHGYTAHGLWELDRFKRLASHGFIVVSIFHGDGRYSGGDNLVLRPITMKQVLDQLLADPDFGPAIDSERIGMSGSSFGGYTMLACLGASTPGEERGFEDPRIKAGFGLVPFTGAIWGMPFGRDYEGMRAVKKPYLAVYSGKDSSVPPETVLASIKQCPGEAMAVCLEGEGHLLSQEAWKDEPTWEILFFNAWLKGDEKAKALLSGELSVRGGVNDHVVYRHSAN